MIARKGLRSEWLWIVGLGLALVAPRAGAAALEFGPRLGYADLKGDLLDGKAEPGKLKIFGCQVRMQLSNATTLEVAGEATSEKFDFEDAGDPNQLIHGKAKWDDLALYASLHLELLAVGPISVYGGGGGGLHFSQIDVIEAAPGNGNRGTSTLDAIDDWLAKAEKDRSDVEWHGLGGAALQLGSSAFSVFGEGRYRDITGDHGLEGWAAYAGLNLRLD